MPQIYDMGPTALLPLRRKACWGIFALKIRRLRPGLNPQTWVLKASTLPLDHQSIQLLRYRLDVPVSVVLLSEETRQFFLLRSVQTESEAPLNLFSTVTGGCFLGGRATNNYDWRLTPPTAEISGALPPIPHSIPRVQKDGLTYFSYMWYCSQLFYMTSSNKRIFGWFKWLT